MKEAKTAAAAENRSITKQFEHWAKIGKLAEDNPDLSYTMIKDIMHGREQINAGMGKSYDFRSNQSSSKRKSKYNHHASGSH